PSIPGTSLYPLSVSRSQYTRNQPVPPLYFQVHVYQEPACTPPLFPGPCIPGTSLYPLSVSRSMYTMRQVLPVGVQPRQRAGWEPSAGQMEAVCQL
ncbi:unnamed protein product, partial [Gadus morhua 'NCC']